MHRVCKSLRLSQDHLVDPEHSAGRPQDLSGRRLRAGRKRGESQLWPRPDQRNLGTGAMKPGRRDTSSRRITPDLLAFYIRRAHQLRTEFYRDMWRAIWIRLTR